MRCRPSSYPNPLHYFLLWPNIKSTPMCKIRGSRIGFPTLMTQEDKAVIYLHSFLLHSATSSSSSPLNSFCLGTFGFYWLALFIRSLLRFGSPRQPFLLSAALFPRHSLKSHSSQISLFPGSYFLPLFILFFFFSSFPPQESHTSSPPLLPSAALKLCSSVSSP